MLYCAEALNVNSNVQTTMENLDFTNLTENKLGFGEFSSDSIYGEFIDDIRFTPGFGWPLANTILQVSQEGNQFSLFYTNFYQQ